MMRSYSCWYEGAEGDAVMVTAWSPHAAAMTFATEHPSEPPRLINVARATAPWIWLYRVYIVRAVERVGKRYGAAPPPRITIQVEDRASAQLDQIAADVADVLPADPDTDEAAILDALAAGPRRWRQILDATGLPVRRCSDAWGRLCERGVTERQHTWCARVDGAGETIPEPYQNHTGTIPPGPEPVAVELPPRRLERRSLSNLRRDGVAGGVSPAYRVVERLRQGPATGLELRELLGLSREGATGLVMGLLREGWIRYRGQQYELAVELVEEVSDV